MPQEKPDKAKTPAAQEPNTDHSAADKPKDPLHIRAAHLALTKAHSHNKKKWRAVAATIVIGVLALAKTMHEFYKAYSFNFKFGFKNIASAVTTIISMTAFIVLTAVASYFHFLPYKPKVEELLDIAHKHIKGDKAGRTDKKDDKEAESFITEIIGIFKEHDFDYTKTHIEGSEGLKQTVDANSTQLQNVEKVVCELKNTVDKLISNENAANPESTLQDTLCQNCQQAVTKPEVGGASPGV